MGISEEIFWDCDINFILSVVENKNAFDGYMNYQKYKEESKTNKKGR